jgi:hypothetical protein
MSIDLNDPKYSDLDYLRSMPEDEVARLIRASDLQNARVMRAHLASVPDDELRRLVGMVPRLLALGARQRSFHSLYRELARRGLPREVSQ